MKQIIMIIFFFLIFSGAMSQNIYNNFVTPVPVDSIKGGKEYGWNMDTVNMYSKFRESIKYIVYEGTEVRSITDGEIIISGYNHGFGNYINIKVNDSIEIIYLHLSRIDVVEKQIISQGDIIGISGSSGLSTGDLSLMLRVNSIPANPRDYFNLPSTKIN